ncbi:hypothetical protein [Arcobacter sp. LA11]|uniref:hypothetical protein n=1 Tax=Arcobacter sp. LA11 TaxID=1898176 RepID=UPI0009351C0E|nr:hypothetical protein [Arcobacter sp. LA11]
MMGYVIKSLLYFICILSLIGCSNSTPNKKAVKADLKGTIYVSMEDVSDYNSKTGVGCTVTKEVNDLNSAHIVCRSKHSGEHAWNAVIARSKQMCESNKWTMLFKRPPALPPENGIYGAQIDIKCIKN